MGTEHRQFIRILAQRFSGCTVRFDKPMFLHATLADISVGGMKIILDAPFSEADTRVGTLATGEIQNSNSEFRFSFSGKIAWCRRSGEAGAILGLQFADYTALPESLMNLVERYGD